MNESIAPFVIVEIDAPLPDVSYWKCAAALEPALPTWVGPAWGQLLATPIDPDKKCLPVVLTRDLYQQMGEEWDHHGIVPINVGYMLTQQASEILKRHGLQPIPVARPSEPDGYIPF